MTGNAMVSLFSWEYLSAFLPITLLLYTIVPKNGKKYILLIASYVFFWCISGKLLAFLIFTTFIMHWTGIWLDRLQNEESAQLKLAEKEEKKSIKALCQKQQRRVLVLGLIINFGILLMLKYTGFFSENINTLLVNLGFSCKLAIPKYVLPIGISFYTMQAVSYIIDVYRKTAKADGNILRLSLFLSFFPEIVEGPICRYSQTAMQLWNAEQIKYKNLTEGAVRIIYGLMKKIIIADRLNQFVLNIFNNYGKFDGGMIALGAIAYTLQLYMDFSGSMDAVLGTSQIFGIELPENFKRPFFSKTASEFWQRWHITLGTWFKDYIFYPVTTARAMKKLTLKAKKKLGNHYGPLLAGSIALLCVWLFNGLWHGAEWKYVFFGLYYFAVILCGNILSPLIIKINAFLHINTDSFAYHLVQMIKTFFIIITGELFFRANGLRAGLYMFKKIITDFSLVQIKSGLIQNSGLDNYDLIVIFAAVIIIFIVGLLNEKGISVRKKIMESPVYFRWPVLYALIMFIVIFGAYGAGYVPLDPIYADF